MSVNTRLRDAAIRHALHAEKFSKGLADKIGRLLNSADADLADTLAKRLAKIEERGTDIGPATTKRLTAMQTELRAINTAVYQRVGKGLKADLGDFAEYEAEWAGKSLNEAAGFDLSIKLPTAPYLRALVGERLIQGEFLDKRVERQRDARANAMEQAIRVGLVNGQTTDEIVRNVTGTKAAGYSDGILDKPRRDLQTIVLTASSTVSNEARQEVYRANSHVIGRVQWLSTLDTRTSSICQMRDGQTWAVDEDHPKPPAHFRCRSVLLPVTKSWRDLGVDRDEVSAEKRASMDGQVAGTSKFEDWIGRQSVARQEQVFGKDRAQLYREGKVTFRDLFRSNGSYKSLDELRAMETLGENDFPAAPEPEPKFRRPVPIANDAIQIEKISVVQKRVSEHLADAHADFRYDGRPEFRGMSVDDFARMKLSGSDASVSMIAAILPELDRLADAFRIPRLRGFKATTAKATVASMGDGVMNINATFFDAFALELTGADAVAEKVTVMLKQIEGEMNDLAETILALKEEAKTLPKDGTSERLFQIIDIQRSAAARYNSLSKKHFKLRSDRHKTAPRPVSKWAPGDDPQTRPYGASDYFEGGVAQARSILYHEFAHHVHQMRGKQGPRRTHGEPPLERKLAQMVKSADMSRQLSKYAMANSKEWFAENFAAYMMGRTDLVDAALITLIEGLLDG